MQDVRLVVTYFVWACDFAHFEFCALDWCCLIKVALVVWTLCCWFSSGCLFVIFVRLFWDLLV